MPILAPIECKRSVGKRADADRSPRRRWRAVEDDYRGLELSVSIPRELKPGLKPPALLDSGGGAESGAIPETIDEMSSSWMCFPRGPSRPELRRHPRVPVQIS